MLIYSMNGELQQAMREGKLVVNKVDFSTSKNTITITACNLTNNKLLTLKCRAPQISNPDFDTNGSKVTQLQVYGFYKVYKSQYFDVASIELRNTTGAVQIKGGVSA